MREQLHIFLNAVMFFTRIPVPKDLPHSDDILNRATRYFPFIGWIVGGIGALAYYALQFVFPSELAVLLSMLATIFATGAFHEDGFADFCDGFGGGYTRARILDIMKDSRIGTYGSIGLIGMLATKFMALNSIAAIAAASVPCVLLAGHALSRLMPVLVIYTAPYSRDDATAKSRPIGKKGKGADLVFASFFGLVLLALFPLYFQLAIVALLLITTFVFRAYITAKIGGYTGDCLGALQQIAELEFCLGFLAFQVLR